MGRVVPLLARALSGSGKDASVLSTTPQLAPDMDLILFDADNVSDNFQHVERWEEVRAKSTIIHRPFHCLQSSYQDIRLSE